MTDLEERVERIEEELGIGTDDDGDDGDEWPNPWSWTYDHRCIVENVRNSGFSLGVDKDGDPLINHDGNTKCIYADDLRTVLEAAEEVDG